MIKKSIVVVQLAIAAALGVLIIGQIGISPERAARINKKAPLWFMNPWRPGEPAHTDGPARQPDQAGGRAEASRVANIRRAVLAPSPALDALLTELESKDLEQAGPMLIPATVEPAHPKPRKRTKPAPAPRKKPAPVAAGPLRITALQVVPAANGVVVRGTTSAPVERMDLYTYASPPRMILELYGQFAPYGQTVSVPSNPIIRSMTTEVRPGKLRIVGKLLTGKATVAPVSRTSSRDGFAVELTTAGGPSAAPKQAH